MKQHDKFKAITAKFSVFKRGMALFIIKLLPLLPFCQQCHFTQCFFTGASFFAQCFQPIQYNIHPIILYYQYQVQCCIQQNTVSLFEDQPFDRTPICLQVTQVDAYTNADQLSQVGQLNGVPTAAGNANQNTPGHPNVRNQNLHMLNSPFQLIVP